MKPFPEIRFFDGPLVPVNRTDLVKRMGAHLVQFESFGNEADAIRSLFGKGYRMTDIVMLVDDARQVAMQTAVVAPEMGKP